MVSNDDRSYVMLCIVLSKLITPHTIYFTVKHPLALFIAISCLPQIQRAIGPIEEARLPERIRYISSHAFFV
jgi:hypothetical protein